MSTISFIKGCKIFDIEKYSIKKLGKFASKGRACQDKKRYLTSSRRGANKIPVAISSLPAAPVLAFFLLQRSGDACWSRSFWSNMCWSRRFWSNMWFLEKDQRVGCARVCGPRSFDFQQFFIISVHTSVISLHETKYKSR
jgi:hypothetical protein